MAFERSDYYLAVKIADDDGKKTEKNIFIGRDKEINEIIGDLKDNKSNKGTRLLLVGESGIGKSALLDEIHRRLTQVEEQDQRNQTFVGYYSKAESLIAPSQFLLYPFVTVLASLVKEAKESQRLDERTESTINRIQRAVTGFAKEEGAKMAEAIIEDAAKKAGLEQTFKVAKGFWSRFKAEKTGLMSAEDYAAKNKDEALQSYLGIFRTLAEEFKERRFVLMFDQFENVGKASTDFFLNFVKLVNPKERFDIIVSFRIDDTIWNDPTIRRVYEEIEQKMINELGAKKIAIEGLSAEDIGKWIKLVRKVSLPLIPDLQRIRENSAGLPLLLEEWIRSEKLNSNEIRRDKLCSQIIRLEQALDEQDQINVYKMSILVQPLKHKRLATYLEMDQKNIDLVRPFVKRLIENRIFDQRFKWFRHDLVQRCFEDDLDNEERRSYHERAARFFESLQGQEKEKLGEQQEQGEKLNRQNIDNISIKGEGEGYSIAISYAYHLHMAGGRYHEKSFTHNKELAEYASKIGDLDIAERCYKRAIAEAEYLGHIKDSMDCLFYMTQNVYDIWARYEESLSNYQSLLEYYDSVNDSHKRSVVLNNIALIHSKKGEYDQALELYNQSLEIARGIGDQKGIGTTLNNIAGIHYNKGENDQALELYNQSLEIARGIGDQYVVGTTLNNMAVALINKEKYEESLFYVLQAYTVLQRLDLPRELQESLDLLNYIEGNLGSEAYQRLVEKIKRQLS
jgi:tetratricopeptide (TPR) repeat protein